MQELLPTTSETADHTQKLQLVSGILYSTGTVKIKAFGTSMLPTIWPGDVLVIEAIPQDKLVCSELVAVETPDGLRVHRLLSKDESHWITRGDAMPQDDPPISPEEILGRVSEIRRRRRVIIPQRQLPPMARGVAWLLRFSIICRITLRLRSAWIDRARRNSNPQPSPQNLAS